MLLGWHGRPCPPRSELRLVISGLRLLIFHDLYLISAIVDGIDEHLLLLDSKLGVGDPALSRVGRYWSGALRLVDCFRRCVLVL